MIGYYFERRLEAIKSGTATGRWLGLCTHAWWGVRTTYMRENNLTRYGWVLISGPFRVTYHRVFGFQMKVYLERETLTSEYVYEVHHINGRIDSGAGWLVMEKLYADIEGQLKERSVSHDNQTVSVELSESRRTVGQVWIGSDDDSRIER